MNENHTQRPTILITGAAGLIGSEVMRTLAPKFDLVALDVAEPECEDVTMDFIRCDLTEDDSVEQAFERLRDAHGQRLASVIHLAAYHDFSGEPSPLYHQLTVEGTRRLLERLQQFQVEQFVFSSSLLVMKPTELDRVLTEASPTETEWEYPESKLRTERVIEQERGEIPAVILRIAGIYDEDCHSIPIAQQIRRIYEKELESLFFPGNTDHGQSFVHLDDVIDCIVRVVDRRGELDPWEVFLIGEPGVMSYAELQHEIGEALHGNEWPAIRIPKPLAKAGAWVEEKFSGEEEETFIKPWMVDLADAHYPVDPSRARDKLGWEPRHSLRQTLRKILPRLKEDPQRWYEVNKLPVPEEST